VCELGCELVVSKDQLKVRLAVCVVKQYIDIAELGSCQVSIRCRSSLLFQPFDAHCCHMGTAVKHPICQTGLSHHL